MSKTGSNRSSNSSKLSNDSHWSDVSTCVLLGLYFLIRIPLSLITETTSSISEIGAIFQLILFLIICGLILINKKRLMDFHIDRVSIFVFLLFGIFSRGG